MNENKEPEFKMPVFPNSIVYFLELPFWFEYEFEVFDNILTPECRTTYVILERIPKREVKGNLPFRTQMSIIIQLHQTDISENPKCFDIASNFVAEGYQVSSAIIKAYRRTSSLYFRYAPVEEPANDYDFFRKCKGHMVFINGEKACEGSLMSLEHQEEIAVGMSMPSLVKEKIRYTTQEIINENIGENIWLLIYEFYDTAKIRYYYHNWEEAVVQSTIAMEIAISWFILKSKFREKIKKKLDIQDLEKKYRDKAGLPKRIDFFLFPVLNEELCKKLREIRPEIGNNKTKTGVYDLRSRVIHDGAQMTKSDAERALKACETFLNIISQASGEASEVIEDKR